MEHGAQVEPGWIKTALVTEINSLNSPILEIESQGPRALGSDRAQGSNRASHVRTSVAKWGLSHSSFRFRRSGVIELGSAASLAGSGFCGEPRFRAPSPSRRSRQAGFVPTRGSCLEDERGA